jgi:Uncharacterized protein conserved in bacteria (DUF2130)
LLPSIAIGRHTLLNYYGSKTPNSGTTPAKIYFEQAKLEWFETSRLLSRVKIQPHTLVSARQTQEGQDTKMELVYQYLTGPKFRHRVEAIVEKLADMQADLDRERKAMTRLWAKRETQILGVVESTVGMYGDLQGNAGKALQEIEALQIPLLEPSLQDRTLGGA